MFPWVQFTYLLKYVAYTEKVRSANTGYHLFYSKYLIETNFRGVIPRLMERIGQVVGDLLFRFQCALGL